MPSDETTGPTLAQIRARTALREAGLDPRVRLKRASSVTNEVWLSATHAVRINRHPSNRLYREALVAAVLPPEVGYPTIVAHGGATGQDWLVSERAPGVPLAHRWPDLSEDERHRAVDQLAERLAALHATPAPDGLPPIERAPQLLRIGSTDPTAPVIEALARAAELPHVEPGMLHDAAEMVTALAPTLLPFEADTLVHGDVTFENVLWHDGGVSALLDMEWARAGPSDLDLDVLLRCAAYPQLHVADAFAARTRAEDYEEVPWWLARAYPALFRYPDQIDRVRIYSIAYDVGDLLAAPPEVVARRLPELHAYCRIERVVRKTSYIDTLGRGRPTQ